jgi:hypothetical protein
MTLAWVPNSASHGVAMVKVSFDLDRLSGVHKALVAKGE